MAFVEITPESICRQRGTGPSAEIEIVPALLAQARERCRGLPMVIHGVELSIGSAHGWNDAYLRMLDDFQKQWPFVWHSEHLGFQTISGDDGSTLEVGVPLPMPATNESAQLIARRSDAILRRYAVPFLLENPAHYLSDLPFDPEVGGEIGLLHAITQNSKCNLLLDLHNLYCNAVNFDFDPFAAIDRMPLDRVIQMHVAGGSLHDGVWMDAHDGRVPERVWDLLDHAMGVTPNVAGVVFELLDEHAVRLGPEVIEAELARAWRIWHSHRSG